MLWIMNVIICFFLMKFDTNGDGAISTAELREAMRKLLGQQVRLQNEVCLSSLIDVCITTKNCLFFTHVFLLCYWTVGWPQGLRRYPEGHRLEW